MSTEPIPPDTIPIPPVIPAPPDGVPYVAPLDPPMTAPIDPCLPSGTTQYGIVPCTPTPTELPATGAGLTIAAIAVIFVAVGAQLRKFPKRRQTP